MRIKYSAIVLLLLVVSGCTLNPSHSSKYNIIYNGDSERSKIVNKTEKPKHYTIAIIPKVSDIPYFNAVETGTLEAAKDMGIHVIYNGPSTASWEKQVEIIEGFITKKVDLIAISADDPTKLGDVLEKAKNHHIKVITWDSDTDPQYRELFINMVDPEVLGSHVMDTLATRMNEKGDYAIITGSNSAENLNEWINWMKNRQKTYYPNMNLLSIVASDDDPNKAYIEAEKLLKDYPDIKGIIGSSSVGPPAAAKAVLDAKKAGQVIVVGLSTPNIMRPYIKENAAQSVTLWSPQKLGYLTVSVAKNIPEGNFPYDGEYFLNVGNVNVYGNMVVMGQPIDFTNENIDQFDF